ncbi:MAG: patatin-like phospholipase family protein, partial [Pseudomonadota bacterium]
MAKASDTNSGDAAGGDASLSTLIAGLNADGTPEKTSTSWEESVFQREKECLRESGHLEQGAPLAGIALSGGGVRSAVVCLGVLGALARAGVLSKFHYLSTVSGGGYAGAAFSHWMALRQNARDEVAKAREEDTPARVIDALRDMSCPFNTEGVVDPDWDKETDDRELAAERAARKNRA